MNINEKLKMEWREYVESYGDNTSKRMHLLSATHVVNKLIDEAVQGKEFNKVDGGKKLK